MISRVVGKLETFDLVVTKVEDIGPITQTQAITLSKELLRTADKLTHEDPVSIGDFHSYPDGSVT